MRTLLVAMLVLGSAGACALAPGALAAPEHKEVLVLPGDRRPAAPTTRKEFVEAVAAWLKGYEAQSGKSLQHPKETVLVYLDLGGAFKDTALDMERNYRLFEGVDGFQYGSFEPGEPLTRMQAAQILRNVVHLIEGEASKGGIQRPVGFKDLPKDAQDTDAIYLLSARRLLAGFPDLTIRPKERLSRPQFETIRSSFQRYLTGVPGAGPERKGP